MVKFEVHAADPETGGFLPAYAVYRAEGNVVVRPVHKEEWEDPARRIEQALNRDSVVMPPAMVHQPPGHNVSGWQEAALRREVGNNGSHR